ncbi:MAG: FmdB family zinc ribbon protein [bacterium]
MPTYVYQCKKCNLEFEKIQSIAALPLEKCHECQGDIQRIISGGSGFIFKGSGFYITDYRSENYKKSIQKEQSQKKESK